MSDRLARLRGWRDRAAAFFAAHRWARLLGTGLLLALPVIFFLRHYLPHPTYVGSFGDIRSFHFWWAVSRKTVLEFGQLPFWNPYYCGGMVHWANVQTMFLCPTFAVNLLFGPGVGLRAHIFLHFIAGFVGCWALARQRGIDGLWSLAPGVVFVFGANLAERATGHVGFMPFLLLPWLLYCLERARLELRFAVPAGLLIAYCVIAGGPYPFTLFWVYLALYLLAEQVAAVWRILAHRRRLARDPTRGWDEAGPGWPSLLRPAAIGAIVALIALTAAALKLYPVIDFMAEYPRHHNESDSLAAWQVWEVFLEPELVRHRKGYFYVFGEYRNYLGPLAMLALPVMLLRLRQRARDYLMIIALGALMIGEVAAWAPFSLLSELPIFGSLRVPVRYAILIDLHVALLFGHALAEGARLAAGWSRRWGRRLAFGLLAAALVGGAVDLMARNNQQHVDLFNTPDTARPRPGPFRMVRGNPYDVFKAPLRNEGHISCYEPNPLKRSRSLRANAAAEVWLAPGAGAGEARLIEWTPNRLRVRVDVKRPRTVVVNLNHHRDWHADGAKVVRERGGLLAAEVPAGERIVELWYRPRRLGIYAGVSLIGLVLAMLTWRWKALRR